MSKDEIEPPWHEWLTAFSSDLNIFNLSKEETSFEIGSYQIDDISIENISWYSLISH